ncbi:MAG: hypothetical protein ACKOA6_06125, partial [Actinomycetota bacterium]
MSADGRNGSFIELRHRWRQQAENQGEAMLLQQDRLADHFRDEAGLEPMGLSDLEDQRFRGFDEITPQ